MIVYYHVAAAITVECLDRGKATRHQVLTSTESRPFIDLMQ